MCTYYNISLNRVILLHKLWTDYSILLIESFCNTNYVQTKQFSSFALLPLFSPDKKIKFVGGKGGIVEKVEKATKLGEI